MSNLPPINQIEEVRHSQATPFIASEMVSPKRKLPVIKKSKIIKLANKRNLGHKIVRGNSEAVREEERKSGSSEEEKKESP